MLVSVRVLFSFHLALNLCTLYSGLTQKKKECDGIDRAAYL